MFWAVLKDGIIRTKTQKTQTIDSNIDLITEKLTDYIKNGREPDYIDKELDCSLIGGNGQIDLSPEEHIGCNSQQHDFKLNDVVNSLDDANNLIKRHNDKPIKDIQFKTDSFKLLDFFETIGRGKSGRQKTMQVGGMPFITTSESNNGIGYWVNPDDCEYIYPPNLITISANGGCCKAFYHNYKFAANADVHVCKLKEKYNNTNFALFICSAINNESWRYDYCRKFSRDKLKTLSIKLPAKNGLVDISAINKYF